MNVAFTCRLAGKMEGHERRPCQMPASLLQGENEGRSSFGEHICS